MQLSLFDEIRQRAEVEKVDRAIRLRPYQRESIDNVFAEWNAGHVATLVTLPTGCGKSVVFSAVIDEVMRCRPNERILVLAHREELIYQALQHAQNVNLKAGIEMGSQRVKGEKVVISTVQTQIACSRCHDCHGEGCDFCGSMGKRRRFERFRPEQFSTLVIDEAHHCPADSYRIVMEYYKRNPALRILMVTATPKRTDNIGLHNVCNSVAYEMDMRTAVKEGWLVPIRQQFVTVEGLDLSKVKTRQGDLAEGEREQAFLGDTDEAAQRMLHAIAYPTIHASAGRRVIVFAAGQEHAIKLTAAFNAYDGIRAECVIDKTDRSERREIIRRFKSGETQVLVNCMVLTEGFDCPDAAVCANCRPTKSVSLYTQMIGRITRPAKGVVDGPETAAERIAAIAASDKPHCLVLDFTGVSGEHKLVSVGDVLAGDDVDPIDLEAALIAAKKLAEPVDVEALIEKVKQAREAKEERARIRRQQRIQTTHHATAAEIHSTDIDIFGGRAFDPYSDYRPAPWQATPGQVAYLMKFGVTAQTATGYSKQQAGAVIDRLSKQTGGEFIITFGKHAGKQVRQIPGGYLDWMEKNISRQDVIQNIALYRQQQMGCSDK